MAVATTQYNLTTATYTDISGGAESCAFRLVFISQRSNAVRIVLGTSLPAVEATNYDEYVARQVGDDDIQAQFTELTPSDRVYARAASGQVRLVAYTK